MGTKDINQSMFYECKARFADLFNGCIFKGEKVIKEEELEELDSVFIINNTGKNNATSKIIADKSYLWKGIYTSVFVLESQSYLDYGMVLRIMKNEVAAYDKQRREGLEKWKIENTDTKNFMSSMYPGQILLPVVTLVLYIGKEGFWDCARELYDLLQIGEELKPFVNNFKINVYDYHKEKDFSIFKTENRLLFELLSASDDKKHMMDILKNNDTTYLDVEVLKMIVGSTGIKLDLNKLEKNDKGELGMYKCKAVEEWEKELLEKGYSRGISQGISQGINEGILQGRIAELKKNVNTIMRKKNYSLDEALDILEVSEEDRKLFQVTH